MMIRSDEKIRKVTSELSEEALLDELRLNKDVTYRPVPHADADPSQYPTWRIRLDLAFDSTIRIGLDVNDEITLGRAHDDLSAVCLFGEEEAEQLGVSRQHALLRPKDNKLYILDLGSTNGTRLNGHSIGVNMPYSLSDGDYLVLGRMEFILRIIKPPEHTKLSGNQDIADVLVAAGRAITSQLDQSKVLEQSIAMTLSLTSANEASIWLVDEQTGELFLEVEQGIGDHQVSRLSVANTLAGQVVQSGQPLYANRDATGDQIKVKTGYLVNAVIYVPLKLGGITVGVLSAAHHAAENLFTEYEERMMMAIAEFTATAIQNVRLYKAVDSALTRNVKIVTALNYALSYDLKNLTKAIAGYSGLLKSYQSFDNDSDDIIDQLVGTNDKMSTLIDRLIQVTTLSEDQLSHHAPLDLVNVVNRALDDSQNTADRKMITLDFHQIGEPYSIQGDAARLYRSILNLLDNAIKFSPMQSQIWIALIFSETDIMIRVRDSGPGVPAEDLPYIFDKYFRSKQSITGQGGIGLGLELVRSTVEVHRGTVIARNTEQGAEFVITLPAGLRML